MPYNMPNTIAVNVNVLADTNGNKLDGNGNSIGGEAGDVQWNIASDDVSVELFRSP